MAERWQDDTRVQWYGSSSSGVRSWALHGITRVHERESGEWHTLCGVRIPPPSKRLVTVDPPGENDCKRCAAAKAKAAVTLDRDQAGVDTRLVERMRDRAMDLPRQQRRVLLYLLDRPGHYVNQQTIADDLGSTLCGIGNVTKWLMEAGLIVPRRHEWNVNESMGEWDWKAA